MKTTLILTFLFITGVISSLYSQTFKYPASYDEPMKVKDLKMGYAEASNGDIDYFNYAVGKDEKSLYVVHHGKTMIMNDSLFNLSIAKNPWANSLFKKSTSFGEFGNGTLTIAGASFVTMVLVTGFAAKFELSMNNRFGRDFYMITGGLALSSGIVGLVSYGINHYFRKKCIKVFNAGYTSRKWSFKNY